VFAGGVAVLSALFERLGIDRLRVSDMALREGLLYEMIGYARHQDICQRTVDSLATRFGTDQAQAQRVQATARSLLDQVAHPWGLDIIDCGRILTWACQLHEIGLSISHSGFHKHGAYILANADLPGFSRQQQAVLAALVRNHRRKFSESAFRNLPEHRIEPARRLCVLLRLAVLMHRGRSPDSKPRLSLEVAGHKIRVGFPEGWLDRHPLTRAELEREADYLARAEFKLRF